MGSRSPLRIVKQSPVPSRLSILSPAPDDSRKSARRPSKGARPEDSYRSGRDIFFRSSISSFV